MKIDDVATRLEALGNPTRLKIYRALVRAGESGLAVGRLQAMPSSQRPGNASGQPIGKQLET